MASKIQIARMALGHIAASQTITNLETDPKPAVESFRNFYPAGKLNALTVLDFPFVQSYVAPTLLDVTDAAGNPEQYYYQYPSTAVKVLKASSDMSSDIVFTQFRHPVHGRVIYAPIPIGRLFITLDIDEAELDPLVANFVALSTAKLMLTQVALAVEPKIAESVQEKWEEQRNIILRNNLPSKTHISETYEQSRLSPTSV